MSAQLLDLSTDADARPRAVLATYIVESSPGRGKDVADRVTSQRRAGEAVRGDVACSRGGDLLGEALVKDLLAILGALGPSWLVVTTTCLWGTPSDENPGCFTGG